MRTLQAILIVGCGGFAGSVLRYLVAGWAQSLFKSAFFPVGTAAVNILGCLVIGLLGGLSDNLQVFTPTVRLFVFIGLLGGFTTFSSFGFETMTLLRDGEFVWALTYVGLNLFVGLAAVFGGFAAARAL